MFFKFDFKKVYDSVKWDFFDYMLEVMGFGDKWRLWMRVCLSIVFIFIFVNGSFIKLFLMERGLR